MRLLAFSDLHRDLDQARALVERAAEVDLVLAAGDYANQHEGLEEAIAELSAIATPTVVVPGNNETDEATREACASWEAATVLHGEALEHDGLRVFGLGAGVPVTPWDWSYDLDEQQATELLHGLAEGDVLVSHSPPQGHCDGPQQLGSEAIRAAIESAGPRLVVCGHIHEAWGEESQLGDAQIVNLGPEGRVFEL